MKKYIYAFIMGILYAVCGFSQIPLNKTITVPESGTKLHQAVLSIKFDKGYTYTPAGGTLTAQIVNPTVGDIAYQGVIDPATYAINTALPVKSLNEHIEVNGTLNYSVDFEVPKGAGGLQPSLGVNYSSSFTDGFLGVGFNISGLSSIDRMNKTIYHDGASTSIAGDLNDAYTLDGKRILLSSGTYGTDGSTYGTELEEFSKIVAVGSSGTNEGPQSFLVYTKSGLIMEYGNTTDSRVLGSGTAVLSWKLNKITDRFNNTITYSYYEYDDERPVTLISYNGNTAQIKFKYKQRSDVSSYLYGGIEFTRNILLDNIEITNNSTLFKRYDFAYMLDNKSQLQKVTEFSSSGQQMNPTVFSWTKQTDGLNESVPYSNSSNQRYITGDYNGDGINDFIVIPDKTTFTTSDKFSLYLGSTNGTMVWKVDKYFKADSKELISSDFNGDGKTDLVLVQGPYENIFTYYESTGVNFTEITTWNSQIAGFETQIPVDYDGNGKSELLLFSPESINMAGQRVPAKYKLYTSIGSFIHESDFGSFNFYNSGPVINSSYFPASIFDYDGDGRTDVIGRSNGTNQLKIFEFGPTGLGQASTVPNFADSIPLQFGDFNGDGASDILKTSGAINPVWSILYYTRNGFVEKNINGIPNLNLYNPNNMYYCPDVNGDGLSDILIWGKGTDLNNSNNKIMVAINKGNGIDFNFVEYISSVTFVMDPPNLNYSNFNFGDYNGDGRLQFWYKRGNTSKLHSFATGTPSNLMQTIINSHGAKTSVNYLPMTNASVYTKGSGAAYPLIDMGASFQLVSSVVIDNGTATTPTTTTTYTYSGGKAHLQGKGFLGFSKLTAINSASGVTAETNMDFDLTYFYPKVSSVIHKKGATLLSTDSYTCDRQIVLNKRIFPFISKTINTDNLTGQSKTTNYYYLATNGNMDYVDIDYGNNHTHRKIFYYNQEYLSSYLIGRPTNISETLVREGVTTTKSTALDYWDNTNAVKLETYNSGDASSWSLTREFDTRGNVKKETRSATGIASQTTEFTFDTSTGVNLEKVKDVNLGNETNYTYYSATGLLKDETDPFSNKITYVYNSADQLYTVTPTTGVTKTITSSYDISGGPSLARYYINQTGNDNTAVKVWYDKTGKEIRNETKGFSGSMIITDKEYLASGLLYRFSEPTNGTTSYWNTYAYYSSDNRLNTFTPKYGPAESYTYSSKSVTRQVNGRDYITYYNNDGSVYFNTDPAGNVINSYWPDGTLKSTLTPDGLTTSMTYDKNGNRLTIADPSAGTITDTWYGTGQQKTSANANGKLTTWYYQADGLLDYVTTDGQTTDYTYNTKGQVTGITSPDGVSRSYTYNTKGQVTAITESVGGVSNTVSFEYDSFGRMYKKTFNSTDYEQYDFQNGYIYKISFNGSTVWQATTIDEYSRVRAANIGATAATWGYNTTTNLLSQIKGTGVQQYDYDFNGSTGNLNSRTNTLKSKTESFGYDTGNLDRLVSVTGTSAQTIGYDATIKGNIATKTDVGTYTYDGTKKYAVKTITNGLNISTTAQSIVYNAFNKVQTITEGTKTAEFVYNADRQRISMTLKTSGATTKTRYYFGGSCEREVVGSTTTQYIWIGGDAYTAVAVATKVGTGSWTVYNIFRDHLGTITHLKTGSTITEFSFDAWGRRRDKDDWSYTLTSEPALFADRGFTAHEFLSDFNLYNMNGRLYDPVVGRFLSPDPYIADLSFSQSYNRYAYALNNPLKYNDPNGELPFLAVLGIVWAGNYAIGWLDNVINKKMSAKEAFRNTNFIAGVNFSPADMSKNNNYGFSNNQSDAQKLVGQQSTGMKKITEQISYINENYNSTGNIWNSPSMRFLIPDRITISIPDVNIAIVAGAGQNVEFNWITRGKDARLMPYCTNTFSQRYGIVGDVGAQLSIGWYPGPASQIQKDFLYGNTHNIDGGYIAGGSVFWALDKSGHPIWIGGGIGFGLTIGVSYGKGYTSPGLDDHPRF